MTERRSRIAVAIALFLGVAAVYAGAISSRFVYYDDEEYVTANPVVLQGLTLRGVRWAFTTGHASNWHPLAWISHEIDASLFGLDARGHHLTSVLLHAGTSALVFVWLSGLTGAIGRSAFVAALFGLHPAHVESVAWVAERKDVLCAFFVLLTLLAYTRYARGPSAARYALVTVAFAAALLAKPMAVTLPFVLMLLDRWPLARNDLARARREKVPWLALSAACCATTLAAQTHAIAAEAALPFGARAANAAIAYVRYLGTLAWPSRLSAFYPHPLSWPAAAVAGALVLLGALTATALLLARKRPYATVGWLWYLGTLVPVIGLVQVGAQARADRYTYLPSIGVFLVVAWGGAELVAALRLRPLVAAVPAIAVGAALALATRRQIVPWTDPIALWDRAIAVDRSNAVAWSYRAYARWWANDLEGALQDYGEAIRLKPDFAEALRLRGAVRHQRREDAAALADYERAIAVRPGYAAAFNNRGLLRRDGGDLPGAIADYERAAALDPTFAEAFDNLGLARVQAGDLPKALEAFGRAIALQPDAPEAYNNRAHAEIHAGDLVGARADVEAALARNPRFVEALANRAILREAAGDASGADADLEVALALDGDRASLYVSRATLRLARRDLDGADADLDRASALDPRRPDVAPLRAEVLAARRDPGR